MYRILQNGKPQDIGVNKERLYLESSMNMTYFIKEKGNDGWNHGRFT
jgi:hypothetical protein